jgi:hypothetical protein
VLSGVQEIPSTSEPRYDEKGYFAILSRDFSMQI